MATATQIIYHTDYATDQLPTNSNYIMNGVPISPAYCIELSEEGKIFEGWYYTPTYDEGTKIIPGETVGAEGMENWYAKWSNASATTVKAKMTAIADEIRVLSGTTAAMGLDAMATNIADANDVVTEQANLIAQLNTALDDLGGTPVEGGASVETCTVTFGIVWNGDKTISPAKYFNEQNHSEILKYSTLNNGGISVVHNGPILGQDYTLGMGCQGFTKTFDCVCGTAVVLGPIYKFASVQSVEASEGLDVIHISSNIETTDSTISVFHVIFVPKQSGEHTITITY